MKREITITINDEVHTATVEHRYLLVDFIREIAGATGTHVGCGFEGRCGTCTVVVDGYAVKSCLMLAVQADGAKLLTIEGLARGEELHPLQAAFRDLHGLQCGFCTPGFLMTLYDFLKDPIDSEDAIRHAMSGVLCRCTGYVHIVAAVRQAIAVLAAMTPTERARWFPL
ncbi:MAG: (2Fe-2S)-binding protein [Gammaproteobacteria bacterium]|nr:(2Fe-2S)-binding protein [Gammaproteobacteria bacterium]